MDDKQRREEKQKLKELRKELEEKIKGIIPDALKSKVASGIAEETVEEAIVFDEKSGKRVIEALLFVSAKSLSASELSRMLKPLTPSQIVKLINELKEEYVRDERSFRINEIAGGYEISTLPQHGVWIAKLEKEKKSRQASLAALETLSILAYKQPVTRVEIEEIRGVDVSGVIATLLERGFIKIIGRKEVAGRPLLYGTTELFLEHFGLKSLNDLPNIEEIKCLVDDTIKKEELLRKEQLVSNVNVEDVGGEEAVATEHEEEVATLAEKYDEISRQIENVKVMSSRKIAKIINPTAEEGQDNNKPQDESTEHGKNNKEQEQPK